MASLYYPQLSTGALAQYPIQKTRLVRTIKNILPDGSMILMSDPNGARLLWQLAYTELSSMDVSALQAHFSACLGPFHAFTFIDPTDNMLVSSSDLTAGAWVTSGLISVTGGAADPFGGSGAFTLTNAGQISQQIAQTLQVPAGYQYCFSLYAMSNNSGPIALIRSGPSMQETVNIAIGPVWTRIVSSGALSDAEVGFTVAIGVAAGQQVQLYGPQLEAQIVPSAYRPTAETGGVYANAHWTIDQLTITATGPNLFSTACGIETAT